MLIRDRDGLGRFPPATGRPAPRPRPKLAQLAAFACLSAAFAATLGFLCNAAPIVVRERGAPLAAVGLFQVIALPIGLTFLWAPALDRLRWPGLPHRLGWIVTMHLIAILALLALMGGERLPAAVLLALAILVSVAFATVDASMEALVVETVAEPDRPAVTTAKLAGASVGGLVGTGLLLVCYDRLGWRGCFAALAALDALCLAPMLRYPETRARLRGGHAGRPAAAARLRPPPRPLLRRALLLGVYFGAGSAAASGYALFLQDLGLSLAAIGFVTGTLGPAMNLVATLAVGALMAGRLGRAVPAERLVAVFAIGVAASGALLAAAALARSAPLAVAGVVLGLASASGLGVPVFNLLYRWAQGDRAATDYSLLFGLGFLAAMPARVGGPALAGMLGWPSFFVAATSLVVGALCLIGRAMRRSGPAGGPAGEANHPRLGEAAA